MKDNSVGPGNEAGTAQVSENAAYAIKDWERDHKRDADKADMVPFILAAITEVTASLRSELEQARELQIAVANQLGWMGPNESLLWKAWKHYDSGKLAEACPSYAELALELPKLLSSLREALEQAREALRKYDFAPWKPPFRYDDLGSQILDSENRMIVDVRGWGFLTGAGGAALKLHEEDARDIQDRLGEHVTKLLNITSVGRGNVAGAAPVNTESALVSSLREVIEQKDKALTKIQEESKIYTALNYGRAAMQSIHLWSAVALAAASPETSEKKEP